jgi:hypothetical protein
VQRTILHDNIHAATKHVQKVDHPIERLGRIRGIEQSVQLCRRCVEPANDLAAAQLRLPHAALGLDREAMEQEVSHVHRILIVIEHRVHMNGVFPTVLERIREGFLAQFAIDVYLTNAVGCGRLDPETAIRKEELTPVRLQLEAPPAVVGGDTSYLHNSPSSSIISISPNIRDVARPAMET